MLLFRADWRSGDQSVTVVPRFVFFFQAEDGIRDSSVTGVQTCALPIYRRRADVHAVVHAHPPTATGFAVAGIALDRPLIAEAVVTLGAVPVIPYGQPSTEEIGRASGRERV